MKPGLANPGFMATTSLPDAQRRASMKPGLANPGFDEGRRFRAAPKIRLQ